MTPAEYSFQKWELERCIARSKERRDQFDRKAKGYIERLNKLREDYYAEQRERSK